MHFTISRQEFLKGLQIITPIMDRRQNMPILGNVLLTCTQEGKLSLVATNLEIELTASVNTLTVAVPGTITVGGKKLTDICRVLPEEEEISFHVTTEAGQAQKAILQAGKSRFLLATLPSEDFPRAVMEKEGISFSVPENSLRKLLEAVSFAMADQDVRYYLNGILLELSSQGLCMVATDGHRLALDQLTYKIPQAAQFILPRKAVLELTKSLEKNSEINVDVYGTAQAVCFTSQYFKLISRLIEGRFPEYQKVIPQQGEKIACIAREPLKQLLLRVAVLTHEKYRAARLQFNQNLLLVSAHNTEQEEVQDELVMDYQGESVEIAFNVIYLLDVLNVIDAEQVKIIFSTPENSVLIESASPSSAVYVIMPMSL